MSNINTYNLIVTKDRRIPKFIDRNHPLLVLNKDQFILYGTSEDGIGIENNIFYNIDSLDKALYDEIKNKLSIPIIYYQFSDQHITLSFDLLDDLIVISEYRPPVTNENIIYSNPEVDEIQFESF